MTNTGKKLSKNVVKVNNKTSIAFIVNQSINKINQLHSLLRNGWLNIINITAADDKQSDKTAENHIISLQKFQFAIAALMQCHQRCTQEGKQLQTDLASAFVWAAGVGGRAGSPRNQPLSS